MLLFCFVFFAFSQVNTGLKQIWAVCRFQNVLLVSVKFFPSLARAGLVEELRHLYVVVILWSGMCSLENLEVKF